MSIAEAVQSIRRRQISPLELTEAHLNRIKRVEPQMRSYITVIEEIARHQAMQSTREIAKGRITGVLHGIPVSYKDLIATKGIRTTAASRVYADWIPKDDANVVARLSRSGAITLGKATLHEHAFSEINAAQDFIKPARNPWDAKYSPGGSSSGSAVGVAAGLAMGSVGTDSGGSVRLPASYCGVTGLKPTYGLIGRSGIFPLSYSLDHVGLLTRSVEDAAIMLEASAGYDLQDKASSKRLAIRYHQLLSRKTRGLTVGVCRSYTEATSVDEETLSAFNAALKDLSSMGLRIREVLIPHLGYARTAAFTILRIEGFHVHSKNLRDQRSKYGASAFRNLAVGGFLSSTNYLRAQQARTLISDEVDDVFKSVDLLLFPATPAPSPEAARRSRTSFSAFNLTGSPALSIPCGFSSSGMPIGLQLIGRAFDESTILAVGHQYQRMTNWHLRRPRLEG